MSKLIFARHDTGRVVHVSSVPGGLACRCACLDCGEPLVARKGEIREHHFGHTSGKEHDWAWETHLHAYAKQLIVDAGGLVVPLHENVAKHLGLPTENIASHLKANDVAIGQEVPMGAVRPDLVLRLPGRDVSIALEVMVTHACDRKKVESFKRQRLAALEIDLSRFPPRQFDPVRVEEAVLRATKSKTWLWPAPPRPARAWAGVLDLPADSFDDMPLQQSPIEPHGPSLPLPSPTKFLFLVRAWNSVVTVSVEPSRDEGVDVRVSNMSTGRMAGNDAEQAAPRIAALVAGLIASIDPDAHSARAGAWFVARWHANSVVRALAKAATRYAIDADAVHCTTADGLQADLTYSRPSRPLQPQADARDNAYSRRRG